MKKITFLFGTLLMSTGVFASSGEEVEQKIYSKNKAWFL